MQLSKQFFWVTLFSIAMGYLEAAVVVYLRAIYYPDGFQFPLVNLDLDIALTELGREAATVIMLAGIGVLTGKNTQQRFAWFLFSFAIWDIFYYVFLKAILNWPESIFTWDILFLIPVPWVGPVICPIIISLSMILLSILILRFNHGDTHYPINRNEWILLIAGSIIVITSFILDPLYYIQSHSPEKFPDYIPVDFDWIIFWIGQALILTAILMYYKRCKNVISRSWIS